MNLDKEERLNSVDHTVDFSHFKIYSEGTLKTWSKNELVDYINVLYNNWATTDIKYNYGLRQIIDLRRNVYRLEEQLIASRRVCKQKQERLDELEKQHMKLLSQWGKSDNPPLKLEELKLDMWVWDSYYEMWIQIEDIIADRIYPCEDYFCDPCNVSHNFDFKFEVDRFYSQELKR